MLLALWLLSLSAAVFAQTAGTQPALVYTYDGHSVDSSILNAISTAGEPAQAAAASSGSDTATALVGAFPTTATVGPPVVPGVTTSYAYSSGSPGEIKTSSVRPPYTATGTINTSTQGSTPTSVQQQKSEANSLKFKLSDWKMGSSSSVRRPIGVLLGFAGFVILFG